MDEGKNVDAKDGAEAPDDSRLQRGGEAGTTRFGMEDGGNAEIPATGGPTSDDDWADGSD